MSTETLVSVETLANMTRAEFAAAIGLHFSRCSHYENGQVIGERVLANLAQRAGLEPWEMLHVIYLRRRRKGVFELKSYNAKASYTA